MKAADASALIVRRFRQNPDLSSKIRHVPRSTYQPRKVYYRPPESQFVFFPLADNSGNRRRYAPASGCLSPLLSARDALARTQLKSHRRGLCTVPLEQPGRLACPKDEAGGIPIYLLCIEPDLPTGGGLSRQAPQFDDAGGVRGVDGRAEFFERPLPSGQSRLKFGVDGSDENRSRGRGDGGLNLVPQPPIFRITKDLQRDEDVRAR